MKKLFTITLTLINMVFLAACTMNSSFDCPNTAGINCKSLGEIDRLVDSGQLQGRIPIEKTKTTVLADKAEFESFPPSSTFIPGQPIRYGETVQRIWIAPYEDSEGNYHQDSLMYSIVKGGHWIGKPVKTGNEF